MKHYQISMIYIDDQIDLKLSEFLADYAEEKKWSFMTHAFIPAEDSHVKLLNNPQFKSADIVIIDSFLFKKKDIHQIKGESLLVYLQSRLPFKKYFLISSQSDADVRESAGIINKYQNGNNTGPKSHYKKVLTPSLDKAAKEIRNSLYRISETEQINTNIKERLIDVFYGNLEYSTLTESNVDELIMMFKDVKSEIEAEGKEDE